jgi:glutamate 5-kinase
LEKIMEAKEYFSKKRRVVVKIGSASLHYEATGKLNLGKMERLVRELCDIRNRGRDVCLVSSGAIAVGRNVIGLAERPSHISTKQACAAVGQARLMMTYQKLFSEYHQTAAQVLMTKGTMQDNVSRKNAQNTFEELFRLGIIPVVNENDTISTYEMQFGDNDTLSALVASLVGADLLVLLSDIDGLFTDDPHKNPNAKLVPVVDQLDEAVVSMAKGTTGSDVGTGGMETKLTAAKIATCSGADMVIANGADVSILHQIFEGDFVGTLFREHRDEDFYIADFIDRMEGY